MEKTNKFEYKPITQHQYELFQIAYDHFNNNLFDGDLPQVLVTLQRKAKCGGYFSPERFTQMSTGEILHEIALNPDGFIDGITSKERIMSIFVHEMVHLWQNEFGENKPRKCYHNKEWADKMEQVGLIPTSTGEDGGPRTGQKMSHVIMNGGAFADVCADLLEKIDPVLFNAILLPVEKKETKKSKIVYNCPRGCQKAWAKPGASLMCGDCETKMEGEEEE